MNKQRKTSNILNVFQYDETTGAVTLPSSLVLTAPAGTDNSTKVPSTAWVRTYVTGLSYLTGNQSISVSGDATGSGTTAITLTLANSGVTAGTYGSSTAVPVVTVDAKGRITSVTTSSISGSITFTGDVTGTGTTGASTTLTLANSGVTAGTYTKVTVDAKGRVTVGTSATTSDISEGTNLYYTDSRARAAISVTGSGSYNSTTGVITVTGGVTSVNTLTGAVTLTTTNIAEGTNLYYTDARVLAYLGANSYATQSYVGTQINNLVAGAPGLLDTLDELAAALGDDANFATTTATSLGNRLRIDTAAQGLNSTQQGNGRTNLGLGSLATLSSIGNSYITDLAWSKLSSTPTTISGYGITNAYTDAQIQNFFNGANAISGYNKSNWDTAYGWGNHASAGYLTTSSASSTYLTSATAATTYVSLTGSYANPSWITSLAYSKITGVPAFLTSYTETDTLATVTGRGNTTTDRINVRGIGNQSGGNILMGNIGVNTNKWSYLTGTHYNTTTQPQGVSIIGLYSDLNNNTIVIGGSIYEANPATEIQFWTHNATSHNLGGTKRMTLNSDGNLSITGTVSASNFSGTHSGSSSGTNTGDQTNITGNAGTATLAANSTLWNGLSTPSGFTSTGTVDKLAGGLTGFGDIVWLSQARVQSFLGLGSLAYSSATIPTNTNQLTNGAGYITGESDTLATVTSRGASTSATLTSTNGLGLYVNSGAASYIGINSTSNWSYVSHLNNGSTIWDVGAFNGGQYEIRPYGGSNNRVTVQLNGQFSVNNSQNQVALFQSGNANTWVDIISTAGTWSMGAAGNNRFAIYNRGGSEGTRFEVSTSAAWVNGNQIWHAGNLTNLNQLTNGPGYITGNQTITLSGDVSGSGTTSISVTIGASRVTNAMLANSSFNIGTTSISLGRASAVQSLTGVRISGIDNTYGNALVQSGAGRTDDANGDTWIFADSLGSDSNKWGIRHDQVSNRIDFWGNNTKNSYIQLNTGVYVGDVSGNASTATNVAWTGVTGRPTALSSFTNDLGNYGGWITSSGSISGNAATATYATSAGSSHGMPYDGNAISGMGPISNWDTRPGVGQAGFGISWHTGVSISGYPGYGGVRLYSAGYPTHASSVLRLEASTAVYTYGGLYSDGNAVIHAGNISSQPVVTIQDGPPSGTAGRLWWESDTGKLKVYYGSAWVDASPIPDSSLFFAKAGGSITGDVSIGQTLNVVGNTLVQGTISAFGDVIAYSSSDSRLKDNITAIELPLEKLSKINGVSFNWNDKQSVYEVGAKDYGVIAQEVEEVLPELVTTRDNGYKAVRYEKIVSLLIEAIKEQQTQINNLTDKLNKL